MEVGLSKFLRSANTSSDKKVGPHLKIAHINSECSEFKSEGTFRLLDFELILIPNDRLLNARAPEARKKAHQHSLP